MDINITSTSESVQFMYDKYLKKDYIVNRKYQRKLVWALEEKQEFIDSLRRQYSVPLFLFAEDVNSKGDKLEIIDGMQRLNAIFSFIENEFPILIDNKEYYFNLETLAATLERRDSGKLIQKTPFLERSICTKIASYPIPISKITANNNTIETVFRRINSYGRQLSDQEIRLAGAVGKFPDLVRTISSKIRGDVSNSDIMTLNDMGRISISNQRLKYGIDISGIFWVKNSIVSKGNIRTSRDEEMVSYLLSYILLGKDVAPTKKTIDSLYNYVETESGFEKINDAIDKYGPEKVIQDFLKVHNIILNVAEAAKTSLREHFCGHTKIHGMFRSYQVIFLSIHNLIIKRGLSKVDINKLTSLLKGIANREFSNIGDMVWNAQNRNSKIAAVIGIIESAFKKDDFADVSREDWTTQLDNLLTLSRSEGTQYDFKQSCHDLTSGQFIEESVRKFVKTLVAMCNKPNSMGYIILGIAEKKESAQMHDKTYGTQSRKTPNGNFYITGIEAEVNKYHRNNIDNYVKKIKNIIKSCNVDDSVKQYILQNVKQPSYYGHDVIVFSLKSFEEPKLFDNKFYIRENNDCVEQTGSQIAALYKSFK